MRQVLQGLAKSIASDGEGATCLIEVGLCCGPNILCPLLRSVI